MQVEVSNKLYLTGCPETLQSEITSRLTFPNPRWEENDRMGRWQGDTPHLLKCYEVDRDDSLVIPRGFIDCLTSICRAHGEPLEIEDRRRVLSEVDFAFTGQLRPYQQEAATAMLKRDSGTLDAPTGSGKTVIALSIIAERLQPTLIVIHTKELLNQWVERIEQFLEIEAAEVGVIGSGKKRIGERITVALVQSLYKCAAEVAPHIGHLIIDECHRAPSRTFTEAVSAFDCVYMLGLSATPWRRDGLSRLIFWHLGDTRHSVDAARLVEEGQLVRAEVVSRETDFRTELDPSAEYSKMLSELAEDEARNRLIASDIALEAATGGGICLALSDRKNHCLALQRILADDFGQPCEVLTGDLPAARRQAIVDRLNAGEIKVLVATGQLIGEGFDCRGLSTLFLATPIRFDGRVLQYLGRVLRPAPGKDKARVYDYLDRHVGPLVASFKARQRVYCRG
jgi:superfamily II DNA or RNA helicase